MTHDVKTSNRSAFSDSVLGTRNLMMLAALIVVGSIILIPLNYASLAMLASPTQNNILYSASLMGLWIIPFLLPAAVVRRPGAFLVTGLLAGIIGAFTTPLGPVSVLGHLLGTAFVGLPLPFFLYRYWNVWVYTACAITFGTLNGYGYTVSYGVVFDTSTTLQVIALSIISAEIGVLITVAIVKALQKAGVGNAR